MHNAQSAQPKAANSRWDPLSVEPFWPSVFLPSPPLDVPLLVDEHGSDDTASDSAKDITSMISTR